MQEIGAREESEISETTPLSDLTDAQISRLTSQLMDDTALSKPLVGATESLSILEEEYSGENLIVSDKVKWLKQSGYSGCKRIRPDGDCFYRAFAACYVRNAVKNRNGAECLDHVRSLLPLLDQAGFQKYIYEEFLEPLVQLLSSAATSTETSVSDAFNDNSVSTSTVVFLRLLTSAFLRRNESDYFPFLFSLDSAMTSDDLPDMSMFCRNEVEAIGKEADHLQIAALSKALQTKVCVAYLDRSVSSSEPGKVDMHTFEDGVSHDNFSEITLLYKPGHVSAALR